MSTVTGARVIAQSLRDLGVKYIFGIVGIPVVEIAEEAINLGIRFIGFRNEQAACYAAGAYGYLTGQPGVCLVVGGPGVLHAIAGVGNSAANAFPCLLLAGSAESHLVGKGAFQELDAVSLLTPHTKRAVRPTSVDSIPEVVAAAFRLSYLGKPGPSFVDFPADLIRTKSDGLQKAARLHGPGEAPKPGADDGVLSRAAQLIRNARAPLIVLGKGAAYAKAERAVGELVDSTAISFLPTPMGKGVVRDSHPQNAASARSTALRHADLVLLLGARLNWILHFGEPPKWSPHVRFIQVDVSAEELGRNRGDPELAIVGDVAVVAKQLLSALGGWRWDPQASEYAAQLGQAKAKNEAAAASRLQDAKLPMTHGHAFDVIRSTLHRLSPPENGQTVYVSEGANTMDISRSMFPVEHPRLRLDAGTYATMGVGPGYAIAAYAAYNGGGVSTDIEPVSNEGTHKKKQKKKIVALEGDSAFGFSSMEVETMARYGMDILVFVLNNGGIYHGDSDSAEEWSKLQQASLVADATDSLISGGGGGPSADRGVQDHQKGGLRSTSLGWQVRYEKLAEACGGKGYFVRSSEELERATAEGFRANVPVVVNIVIEAGKASKLVSLQVMNYRPGALGVSTFLFQSPTSAWHLILFDLSSVLRQLTVHPRDIGVCMAG